MSAAVQALLARAPRLRPGHVWLAGAGPGDPGCLTLDVVSALEQAEVVVHDALVSPEVLGLAPETATRIFAGKRGGKPSAEQADITATLITQARAGRRVVRLKGGDPFVFGRGGEEAAALVEAGIPVRVLPGLTAGLAGLAAAQIPATMRQVNQAVILATGHGADSAEGLDWAALARAGQPIVLYMALHTLPAIVPALLSGGLSGDTPAALVYGASTAAQKVVVTSLDGLVAAAQRQGGGTPAVIAIGHIVSMRARLLALAEQVAAQ